MNAGVRELLEDEARLLDILLGAAALLKPQAVQMVTIKRRALTAVLACYERDSFPDEGIGQ